MTFMALQFWIFENDDVTCKRSIWIRTLTRVIANFGKEWQPRDEVAPQALMGLFGGRQVKTNMAEFSAECQGFDRTKDSNKIEVIVLDDQKSRELRRTEFQRPVPLFIQIQFSESRVSFSQVLSTRLNTDETILMPGTDYFGETALKTTHHTPVNTMRKSHNHTLLRHWLGLTQQFK